MKQSRLAFFSLALSILCLNIPSAKAAENPSGIVLEVQGMVQIKNTHGKVIASTDKTFPRTIKKDAPFYEGETIITGPQGKLKLQFAEGKNEVQLGPNTTLVIQRAPFDLRMKRGSKLFLESGSVDSVIKQKYTGKDGDEFAIETRALVAGVRGTKFQVTHESNVSSVEVYSGVVDVKSLPDGVTRGLLKVGDSIKSSDWKLQHKDPSAADSETVPSSSGKN